MTEKASQDEWLSEGQYLLPADDFVIICFRGATSSFSSEKLCGSEPDQGFNPQLRAKATHLASESPGQTL